MARESFFRDAVTEMAKMQAERLVGFLNATESTARSSREVWGALEIFEQCQRLEKHQRQSLGSTTDRQINGLIRNINAHLEEFSFLAVLGPWRNHPYVWWRPAPDRHPRREAKPADGKRLSETSLPPFPLDVIRLILTMTEAGTLGRIRKCICGTWFFAQTNKKQVCGTACRSQKFHQEHADYMRRYRKVRANLKKVRATTRLGANRVAR